MKRERDELNTQKHQQAHTETCRHAETCRNTPHRHTHTHTRTHTPHTNTDTTKTVSGPYGPTIHETYSSPATLTACTPSPVSCYWHRRAQLQVVGRAVLQWQQGSGLYGPIEETHPSTKCIAVQPPSPHAYQAPYLATGTLEHSSRWLAGLWCSGNKGLVHIDLLERHTHPRNV
jgi:hypothetical protein